MNRNNELLKTLQEKSIQIDTFISNDQLNDEDLSQLQSLMDHPEIYIDQIFKYISWSLFFLMPVFALLLLLFFRKSHRYYVTHLIFSLNQHAFLFSILIILMLVNMIFPEKEISPENILLILPPIFLFVGSKKLYMRSWTRTIFSLMAIGFLYLLIIIPVVLLVTVIAFQDLL